MLRTLARETDSRLVVDVVRGIASHDCAHERPGPERASLERCHWERVSTRQTAKVMWFSPFGVAAYSLRVNFVVRKL